jgi:signal transduction histidine kinase
VVTVEEDGPGFDPEAPRVPTGGLGPLGMRVQAEMLGGRLAIGGMLGAGTTVYVEVPL